MCEKSLSHVKTGEVIFFSDVNIFVHKRTSQSHVKIFDNIHLKRQNSQVTVLGSLKLKVHLLKMSPVNWSPSLSEKGSLPVTF